MPTKTDRILSYLPRTFQTSPRPPVLYPVADAFGNELLLGENTLAAVMLAHWIDFADKGAETIVDLERIAALYGLAPRSDEDGTRLESVEEFREHLKRYIRTFLEGTATVQGVLRVTAEALGLRIADEAEKLDRWWARHSDEVVTVEPRGDDAAALLRFDRSCAAGSTARPAQVTGSVDLSGGIEFQGASILRLRVDGIDLGEIDLAKDVAPPAPLTLDQIVDITNQSPRPQIARHDGRYLTLASPQTGPESKLELLGGPNDAVPRLLGLGPRSYHGTAATAAQVTGMVDLSEGVDLSRERFLRVEVDGKHLAEIDCAGTSAAQTTLPQIREVINQAFSQPFGFTIASDDGKHLILTSPTKGFQSSISVQPPAAQNAAARIFGAATAFQTGRDDQPARVTSSRDLRGGVDLSERANVRLRIDGAASVTVNCAGVDPANTQRIEIATAINAALKAEVASVTERGISLVSPTAGPAGEIVFETAPVNDAASDILGIDSLSFKGSAPTKARLAGTPVLTKSGGVDVRAQNVLSLAVDGGAPIEIDLRQAASTGAELASVPLGELTATINRALGGANVATTDGHLLLLTSPTEGGASSLAVEPQQTTFRRRFVTRAIIIDEATRAIFGFDAKDTQGAPATKARVVGAADLSQSVDLREARLLRLKIDSYPVREIDCAGPRSRATTLDEIVTKINTDLKQAGLTKDVAAHDGRHLGLISPSSGIGSRVVIELPLAALETLLGVAPGSVRGQDATQVRFTSTVDLSAGIGLDPQAAIKLGLDGDVPVEISLGGPAPNHQSPFQIMNAINTRLNGVASSDGRRIVLSSAKKGTDSKIAFELPSGHDATKEIFGITPPRAYQGDAAAPARVVGARELNGTIDLSVSRFLRLSIDGDPPKTIDCAAKAAKPEAVALTEIVQSIGAQIASISEDGKHLILTSPTTGLTGEITLEAYTAGDARSKLLGDVKEITEGTPDAPAVITGKVDLLAPVNLAARSLLRLVVNGGRPRDIDVAGEVPAKTFVDEIVAKINTIFPNLAAATGDDHLQLTSPAAGEVSSLSLLPLRYLEVIEYPPRPAPPLTLLVRHGANWSVVNDGAADAYAEVNIIAPQGTVGPTLINSSLGWSARLFTIMDVGETARLRRDAELGLRVEIVSIDGKTRPVPGSRILIGPLGAQAWVPFEGTWIVVGEAGQAARLQLNNPLAPAIVLLRSQQSGDEISVGVSESDLTQLVPPSVGTDGSVARLVGRVHPDRGEFRLVDASGYPMVQLRAGPHANLSAYQSSVVKVTGPLHAGAPPLMIVQTVTRLFDVTLCKSGVPAEPYPRVTIGVDPMAEDSLVWQINTGSQLVHSSTLVRAEQLNKATILGLPSGNTGFHYLDCQGGRFDQAQFDRAYFPDRVCGERGVFDVSRFTHVPPELVRAVFTSADTLSDPPVKIDFHWSIHRPGSFIVNLPADLPARFGGRFNEARFGQGKDSPELYAGAVVEPETDDKFLVKLINEKLINNRPNLPSNLVTAEVVGSVPLGWSPVKQPFRKPQFLTLGRPGQAARLYLAEEGLNGFIKVEAKEPGAGGNEISVTARQVGPAIYDVSVIYRGSRFENARSVVVGQPPAELAQALSQPGPVGVLQAKAAGVWAMVTRDRAEFQQLTATA